MEASYREDCRVSPLEAAKQWLAGVDEGERKEIGFLLSFLLFDGTPSTETIDAPLTAVVEWLEQPTSKSRAVGKAVTFRACFEHIFAGRFTAQGWAKPEGMFRNIIDQASKDQASETGRLAGHAFKMLRGLPEREALWKEIAASWRHLVQEHLTDEALTSWQFDYGP